MHSFGFIGFGSMARTIIAGLVTFAGIDAADIIVTRKDLDRLNEITEAFPFIRTCSTSEEVAQRAKCVFVCTKPLETKAILTGIRPYITPNTHVVIITAAISFISLQKLIDCKLTKYIPTITSVIGEGVSLVCHNNSVTQQEAVSLESVLNRFGVVKAVPDEQIGFATELTSCGPGLFASIFNEFVKSAGSHLPLNQQQINELVTLTLCATARLVRDGGMDFEQVIRRVTTKGGVTMEGVEVFRSRLPQVFGEMFEKTLAKRQMIEEKTRTTFDSQ